MLTSTRGFRILYNLLYYALYLILLGALIVSPADLMRQALQHHNNTNILIIAASYLVTILVLAFIYATRLYINRSVLASIPKGWIPVEKSDGVPGRVRRVIELGLSRSAVIAWEARPRVGVVRGDREREGVVGGSREGGGEKEVVDMRNKEPVEEVVLHHEEKRGARRVIPRLRVRRRTGAGVDEGDIATAAAIASISILPPKSPGHPPVWGEIEHPGWASPTSPDLPNLQYSTVIKELPNLIEAKALTLAPPDPESRTEPPMLDPDAVAVLQRPETTGLREYLVHLTELGVLTPTVVSPFITRYEAARFSTRPVSNEQFRGLMHLFAEILRAMHPLDPAVLAGGYDDDEEDDDDGDMYESAIYESDIDNDAPRGSSSSASGSSIHTERGGDDVRRSQEGHKGNENNRNDDNYLDINYNNPPNNNLTRLPSSSPSTSLSSRRRRQTSRPGGTPLTPGLGGGLPPPPRTTTPSMFTARNSSANTWQQPFLTAPTTPKSRHTARRSSRSTTTSSSSGVDSFAQTRHPFMVGDEEGSSGGSVRSVVNSLGSSGVSSGSVVHVIRLASGEEESLGGLPYVLERAVTM